MYSRESRHYQSSVRYSQNHQTRGESVGYLYLHSVFSWISDRPESRSSDRSDAVSSTVIFFDWDKAEGIRSSLTAASDF